MGEGRQNVSHAELGASDIPSMSKDTYRIVTRGTDGQIRIRDYNNPEALLKRHTQVGVDDCSTDLGLRGLPVFRGLIGPIPEGKNIIRYESPDVFETLTKEWSTTRVARRKRSRPGPPHINTKTPALAPQALSEQGKEF